MLIRFTTRPVWAPDEAAAGGEGVAAGATGAAAEKAPTGGDKGAGSDAGTGADPAAGGSKEAAGSDTSTAAIGSNSGKTEAEALAELALDDALRGKLIGSLPKEAQERASQWLKRRSSLPDLLKSGLSSDSKITELTAQLKGTIRVPGKDAKPEEIAAYRKAVGVPESAEKYAVYRPEKFEPTKADTEAEQTYLEAMHAAGASQQVVDAGLKAHYLIRAQAEKAMADRAKAVGEAAIEDLRVEYGRDYKANVTLADRWLKEHLAPDMGDGWKGLMNTQLADGTYLGANTGFVKAIVKLAKGWADDGAVEMTELGSVEDPEAELKKMMSKFGTEEYKSPAFQQRLDAMIARKNKLSGVTA